MAKGYGLGVTDEKVLFPDPPLKPPEDRIADDIHAIKERAVLPIVEQKFFINFTAAESAAGVIKTIDMSSQITNSIQVSVFTGTLDFWLGDDAAPGGFPDYRFTNVGQPVQLLLPPKARRFSFLASGAAACQAKVIVLAV